MADTKISGLTAAAAALASHEYAVNEAGVSKKVTATQLGVIMPTLGSYTPGSFTVPTGGFAHFPEALILTGSQQGTFEGTSILRID